MTAGYLLSRLISAYIGYMIVMSVLVLIVPHFESVFNDFAIRTSPTTQSLIEASRLCRHYFLWAVCLPVPAMWAMVNAHIADKHRRRRLRLTAFLLVVGFLVFTLFALFPPLSYLIHSGVIAVQQ